MEYILWGISWINLNLLIADLPQYNYDSKEEKSKNVVEGEELETIEDFENFLG